LPEVRKEIALADKIFCKLDAWSDDILQRVDRPHECVSLESIISGITLLRREFQGFLAIQTMILRSPKDFEIEDLAKVLGLIKPDEVQLNLPTRPVPQEYFVETRGNEVEAQKEFTQLKTISREELEILRSRLSELTDLPIITR
jgi:wyosine [tRNA(Phe)-imidazoG37] synthetase (radical SAM superfamily)